MLGVSFRPAKFSRAPKLPEIRYFGQEQTLSTSIYIKSANLLWSISHTLYFCVSIDNFALVKNKRVSISVYQLTSLLSSRTNSVHFGISTDQFAFIKNRHCQLRYIILWCHLRKDGLSYWGTNILPPDQKPCIMPGIWPRPNRFIARDICVASFQC